MEHQPHNPDDNERNPGVNSYGTDDPETQAHIENARIDAARERRRDRAALERLVELGLSPDDAEAVIEIERATEQTRADGEHARSADIEEIRRNLAELLNLRRQPEGAATLAAVAADLRRDLGGAVASMPANPAAVASYQTIGLDRRDALTVAGFEYYLRYKLASAHDPAATLGIESGEQAPQYQPRVYVTTGANDEQEASHGGWIDAAQPAEAIEADVAALLDNSPPSGTGSWTVAEAEGFANLKLAGLSDINLIGTLGRGMAEHGAAFVAWTTLHGTGDRELLARFSDFYVDSYLNERDWAEAIAIDLDWLEHLDQVVDPTLRPFVNIDYHKMARSARGSWDVVTGPDGRVYVFLR